MGCIAASIAGTNGRYPSRQVRDDAIAHISALRSEGAEEFGAELMDAYGGEMLAFRAHFVECCVAFELAKVREIATRHTFGLALRADR